MICPIDIAEQLYKWEYNGSTIPFGDIQEEQVWVANNSGHIPNPYYDPSIPFSCETMTEVYPHVSCEDCLEWLREEHGIIIWFVPGSTIEDAGHLGKHVITWNYFIKKDKPSCSTHRSQIYDSYNDAVLDAIRYAFEHYF